MRSDEIVDHRGRPLAAALVTGAAGFIGSHLCERLLAAGVRVTGIDAFTDYYAADIKERNAAALRAHPDFTLVEKDIVDVDVAAHLDGVGAVFHLAAQPGVRASWGDGFRTYVADNILASQHLLEAMSGSGIRLVYSSSSSVYGDAETRPTPETAAPLPVSPYGATKLTAENLCRMYTRDGRVDTVSLRYFTVFGPRQRPDMAFTRFIDAIHAGRPITVYGDGGQSRDFTFVADAVDANLQSLAGGRPGGVYNVGGGEHATLAQVIDLLGELTGREVAIDRRPAAPGDARHTSADVTRAREDFGFAPKVGLREGLRRQIAYAAAGAAATTAAG